MFHNFSMYNDKLLILLPIILLVNKYSMNSIIFKIFPIFIKKIKINKIIYS